VTAPDLGLRLEVGQREPLLELGDGPDERKKEAVISDLETLAVTAVGAADNLTTSTASHPPCGTDRPARPGGPPHHPIVRHMAAHHGWPVGPPPCNRLSPPLELAVHSPGSRRLARRVTKGKPYWG
jgi:hypothetical protein